MKIQITQLFDCLIMFEKHHGSCFSRGVKASKKGSLKMTFLFLDAVDSLEAVFKLLGETSNNKMKVENCSYSRKVSGVLKHNCFVPAASSGLVLLS